MCWSLVNSFPTFAGSEGTLADRAMRVLDAFSLVYFFDNFEAAAAVLFEQIGITPAVESHNIDSASGEAFDIDESFFAEDNELYRRARERFWQSSVSGPLRPKEHVISFASQTPDMPVLRAFLYNSIRSELKLWKSETDFSQQLAATIQEATAAIVEILRED